MSNDGALEVCEALARASSVVSSGVEAGLGHVFGLGFTDLMIMRGLAGSEVPPRRVDLAERMGMTASGVTRALVPLEKLGLVDRVRDARDARASRASLAEAGREKLRDATESAAEQARRLLTARLEASEIAELGRILAKLNS